MKIDDKNLKLIYVLKIGHNTKGEGIYEFIFSLDTTQIDVEGWCWDQSPACDHATPPTENYIDDVITLKTKTFDLFCLHEAVDREYLHGYNTIHALAYEIEKESDENGYDTYDSLFGSDKEELDDLPLLVFHYGTSLAQIKEMLYNRKIIFKKNEFIDVSAIKI